jgi:hypothetical protein
LLMTVAVLSHHFGANGGAGVWAERAGAIVFLLIGLILLRVATRAR